MLDTGSLGKLYDQQLEQADGLAIEEMDQALELGKGVLLVFRLPPPA